MNESKMLGFDYPDRKNTGDLSEPRAKLSELETELSAEKQKNNELQNTVRILMTSAGIVIVVLLVAIFVLASAKQMA
jgi:uncharacterized membrane protein YkgB